MQDKDHCFAQLIAQAADDAYEVSYMVNIQIVGRFIQQDIFSILCNDHGNIGTLPLTAGQFINELLQKLAAESGFDESYIKEVGEYTPGGFLASAFTDRSFGPTNEDLLWKLQYRIIRELAEKEPCVIVGRCADFILQDRTDCLKVFVHADLKFRADRIVRVYGEREKSPEARLKEKDKRRAACYRFYTDMKWGDAANYHIALDSGVIGIEKSAEIIESLA